MGVKQRTSTKRVCILGAGASGLCAARHSVDAGHDVTVFEQQHDLGGTWLYSPQTNSISSLYEKMNTNIPKEVMGFEHLPLETDGPQSFIRHQEVLAYLQRYAKPIRDLINFNTIVTKIKRDGDEWKVSVRPTKPALNNMNEITNGQLTRTEIFTSTFCLSAMAISRNLPPKQPRVPVFAEKFRIPWLHCHNYRRPHAYKDQEVAVVGAGPSGVDVGIQLSKFAKTVHLLHNQKYKFGMPVNVLDNARLVGIEEDGRTLLLENGEKLTNISAVIFCTGYIYEVPFCEKELIEAKSDGRYLSPLYLHSVHVNYPTSLFFIGLCWNLIPFVCFDFQVNYALALVDGRARVPSKVELESFEIDQLRKLKETGSPIGFYHGLGKDQWPYFDLLAKLSNVPCLPPVIRLIYDHVHDQRSNNLATFKSFRYRVTGLDSFEYEALADLDCN